MAVRKALRFSGYLATGASTVTNSFLVILLVVLPLIFVWASIELRYCLGEAQSLRRGVSQLERGVPPKEAFPGELSLQHRAAAIAQRAQNPVLVAQVHPERELSTISAELYSRLARPRALAGLLIILGLLITLTNLKSAVDEMKMTLAPAAESQTISAPLSKAPTPAGIPAPEAQVRKGISGIATAAGTAFGYSTLAIGLAALILFISIIAQRGTASALASFATWLSDTHDDLLEKQAELPQDTAAKLAFAAESLARVAKTFEETNAALSELKTFSGKLDSAAQEISGAVASLPTQIDNSMTKISGDVAQGIRSGLEHQGVYLNSLVAIYSDHATTVQKTIEFISRVSDATKEASEALVHLRSLPEDIRSVVQASTQTKVAAEELTVAVQSLDRKVDALPAGELASAATQLSDAAARLIRVEADLTAMQETTRAFLKTAIDDATRRNGEAVAQQLSTLAGLIQAVKSEITSDSAKHSAALKHSIVQLSAAVDRLGTGGGVADLKSLREKLQQLNNSVGSLPSIKIMRLFGAGRAGRS
jgi:phosphate uptake regulator